MSTGGNNFSSSTYFTSELIILYCIEMLQTIVQYSALVFPHTFGRLAYWHLLLFYDNTGLLDLQYMIFATLPSCIYFIHYFAAARDFRDDDDDERLPEDRPGPFRVILGCLKYWFLVYKAFDLLAALDVVLRASGFCGKAILAIDLLMESTLVLLAKTIFFLFVSISVGAALEGFPFVQSVILDLQEAFFGRNEVPADEAFHEE